MDRSLHPGLARIAATYDQVVLDFQQGRIGAPEARRRILALVARDDNGIEWSIDPDTGHWRYRSTWGDYLPGEPPAYGVRPLSPSALGSGEPSAIDARLSLHEVELSLLAPSTGLAGSTIVQRTQRTRRLAIPARQIAGALLVLAVALLVVIAVTTAG